jgi:hypothetical protein
VRPFVGGIDWSAERRNPEALEARFLSKPLRPTALIGPSYFGTKIKKY